MGKYALFDWDNTLRKGFTICDWVQYLSAKEVINVDFYRDILYQFELSNKHVITYQQLSDNTTNLYAKAITGINVSDIKRLGKIFCSQDHAVFPYVCKLFNLFRQNNIEIIVISGTPHMLLEHYSKIFGIHKVYGMVIGVNENCFSGIIEKDYGIYKAEIVREICKVKREQPLFALGDSIADKPLIKAAKYGCYIDKATESIYLEGKIIGTMSSAYDTITNLGIFDL